jgi:hypothetical protein
LWDISPAKGVEVLHIFPHLSSSICLDTLGDGVKDRPRRGRSDGVAEWRRAVPDGGEEIGPKDRLDLDADFDGHAGSPSESSVMSLGERVD